MLRIKVSTQWSRVHLGTHMGMGMGDLKDTQGPSSLQKISLIFNFYHLYLGHKSLTVYSQFEWMSPMADPGFLFEGG